MAKKEVDEPIHEIRDQVVGQMIYYKVLIKCQKMNCSGSQSKNNFYESEH